MTKIYRRVFLKKRKPTANQEGRAMYTDFLATADKQKKLVGPIGGADHDEVMRSSVCSHGSGTLHPVDQVEHHIEESPDKFASCELIREGIAGSNTSGHPEEEKKADAGITSSVANFDQLPLPKTELELAIERCSKLDDQSDSMTTQKWSKRAAPILKESLNFLVAYEGASDEERQSVRKTLKAKSGVTREPNINNLPVIAVYLCVSSANKTRSKALRNSWCRFATVVKVAVAASVRPDNAANWLDKKTLNAILGEWQAIKKAGGAEGRKSPVPKVLKEYAHLAAALTNGSKFQALAKAELAKIEILIAEEMAKSTFSTSLNTSASVPADA